MIEGNFDSRTLADIHGGRARRSCWHSPIGERHELRRRVAESILLCASGTATLGALTETT